jgi:predicted transcriptional regulator
MIVPSIATRMSVSRDAQHWSTEVCSNLGLIDTADKRRSVEYFTIAGKG